MDNSGPLSESSEEDQEAPHDAGVELESMDKLPTDGLSALGRCCGLMARATSPFVYV